MPDVNVLFKKGSLSDLFNANGTIKTGVTIVEGALYFALNTSDSGEERGKLYLGEQNQKLIPIGEDVVLRTVSQISALPTASLHKGEFYYSETGNILAYSNGSTWAQVNSSARLLETSGAMTSTVTNNVATVNMTVQDQIGSDATSRNTATGSFSLTGSDNITLAGSGNNITISAQDTTYELSGSSAGTETTAHGSRSAGANILLTETGTSTTTDTLLIKSTDSVVATYTNGHIELAVDTSGVGSVTSLAAGTGKVDGDGTPQTGTDSTHGFHYKVSSTTSTFGANIDPQITVKNAAGNALTAVHFVDGVAALDVYSTDAVTAKINDAMQAANAMTYRGSANTASAITGAQLHNGDVFLATNGFSLPEGYTVDPVGATIEEGYLIVVHGGTENNGVISNNAQATYTIIKANDTDTTYSVSGIANGMQFNQGSQAIGTLTLSGGTAINISSGTSTSQVITVSHATVTTTSTTTTASEAQYSSHTATLNVVTSVSVNSQGHVTDYTITPNQITDTGLKSVTSSVAASSNTATVSFTVEDSANTSSTAAFSLTSDSLNIATTTTTGQLAVNLVWGSF